MVGGAGGRVQVIDTKGCSRLFVGLSPSMPSFRSLQSFEPESPPSASSAGSESMVRSHRPFAGLVICVTGLSKEARKQVMQATERLGGQYSPNLHPQCTHLVVQSFSGRKIDQALKHGSKNGLFVVTLGWFVDSVRKNVRLCESLYSVRNVGDNGVRVDELNRLIGFTGTENSGVPVGIHDTDQSSITKGLSNHPSGINFNISIGSTLSGDSMYVDSDISEELRRKVYEAAIREGSKFSNQWSIASGTSHVVCEGSSVRKYLGYCNNIVTPMWVLKMAKEKHIQDQVHMSTDLAMQIGVMLENFRSGFVEEETDFRKAPQVIQNLRRKVSHEERVQIAHSAKIGIRNRRSLRMQTCQSPMLPMTPSILLDSICWSISEPTSSASIYTDSFSSEDGSEHHSSVFFDAKGETQDQQASFANLTRPLKESEKFEMIFKNHFLTILFPIDRFSEMGPSSRTFFSEKGFTCTQVLHHIYAFYQESMSAAEIEAAIHTDSRHADRLRSVYSSKETVELGYVNFKRIDFLGSRKNFEMLKRVSGYDNSGVYELLIRA